MSPEKRGFLTMVCHFDTCKEGFAGKAFPVCTMSLYNKNIIYYNKRNK